MTKLKIGFFFLILYWPLSGFSATERDFQTWLNATAIGTFHSQNTLINSFRFWLEGQERIGQDSTRFSQTLYRLGLGYAFNDNATLWLGYSWIHTGEPFTRTPFKENRVWQQFLWVKTGNILTFTSRTRTEQRFLENNPKTAYRARQMLKFSIPFKSFAKLSLVTFDELFWHKNNFIGRNSKGFDQNRFFLGLGYKITPALTTEFGYLNQYIRRFGVPNFLNNAVSLNLFFTL